MSYNTREKPIEGGRRSGGCGPLFKSLPAEAPTVYIINGTDL